MASLRDLWLAVVVLGLAGSAAADSGPVVGWGHNSSGQAVPPASVNGSAGTASAIAAGNLHSCAIQAETGVVVCWGQSGSGATTPHLAVNGLGGTASAITAGGAYSCAMQAGTGAVVCWGFDYHRETKPPAIVSGVAGTASAIASGQQHNCAIRAASGAVVCWGRSFEWETLPPDSVNGTAGTASAIAAGAVHSCAIQAGTGAVVCWGAIGQENFGQATPPPSVNGTAGTASAIAAGAFHSCAIQAGSGAVVCWGHNTFAEATPPASVNGTAGTASAIAAGFYNSCAIQAGSGAVVCWGNYSPLMPPASVDGIHGAASAIAVNEHALAIRSPGCSDGFDNDDDGAVDYPADPACDSPSDWSERDPALICDDGIDNDGDGSSDYPSDLGCDSSIDVSELSPALVCDDGIDNDGDGLADIPSDPGCSSPTDASERSPTLICDDGIDNDEDGGVDFPDDPNCVSLFDPSENPVACDDGIDNDGDGLVDFPSDPGCESPNAPSEYTENLVCDDGIDNDGDGLFDYPSDPNCHSRNDPTEQSFTCDDGVDNDDDGLTDAGADPGCASYEDESEMSDVVCDNGIDDDGDGRADYPDDRNCASGSDSSESPDQCDDGIDNDGNGLVDYPADPGCADINDVTERQAPVFEFVMENLQSQKTTLTIGGDGNVYGTRHGAGPGPGPSVFRIDGAGAFDTIYTFGSEGPPVQPLVRGTDGALYGLTQSAETGTIIPCCTFFRLDSQGSFTPYVVSLPSAETSQLVLGGDGAFYTALMPRSAMLSWVFQGGVARITSAGAFTLLGGNRGLMAGIPFAAGRDGAVYGTRDEARDFGVPGNIIRWDTDSGQDTEIHAYSPPAEVNGNHPSGFTLGSDGLLYAVTPYGGYGDGAVFRFDTAGNVTLLHQFHGDGAYPSPPMTLGSDGAMYGVTEYGGANNGGTVFRIDPTGTFTSLYSFDYTHGGAPNQSLVLARDGALYGISPFGIPGPGVFRVDPSGTVDSFPVLPQTLWPVSPLVQGSDCAFYGVAATGPWDTAVYRVFEPGHLCQRVEFDSLSDRIVGDPPFTISATSSSGLPVSFIASGNCSISGDQVTLTGVGTCTLTASQVGDSRYEPAREVSQSFDVLFDFTGFLRPVLNPPVVNRVKAGRTVPVRFSLGGDQGRDVLADGSPSVRPVPCDASGPVNDIEGLITKRPRALVHAPKRGRYTYLWQTDKRWAGTCQELSLELIDGSVHRATFRFERPHQPHGGHPKKH